MVVGNLIAVAHDSGSCGFRKRIPRKISIFILVPLLSVVIIFMMSENNKEAEQSFHTLEEAVTAYDDRSDVVATLRGKTSALVIMDDGDVMDSQILKKQKAAGNFRKIQSFRTQSVLQETGL